MPYSCLRHTSTAVIPERNMKTTFPGSYFTKLLCKQTVMAIGCHYLYSFQSHLVPELGPASLAIWIQVGPEAHRKGPRLHLLAWQQLSIAAFEFPARQALALNQQTKMSFHHDGVKIFSHFIRSDDIYPSKLKPTDRDTNTAGKHRAKDHWSNRSWLCSEQALLWGCNRDLPVTSRQLQPKARVGGFRTEFRKTLMKLGIFFSSFHQALHLYLPCVWKMLLLADYWTIPQNLWSIQNHLCLCNF